MENQQISKVTIVGGGTVGWLSASLLSRIYRRVDGAPSLDISVIESPSISTVGVGEATVPAMPRTLMQLGISEQEFSSGAMPPSSLGSGSPTGTLTTRTSQ